jgi:hypothetical protein
MQVDRMPAAVQPFGDHRARGLLSSYSRLGNNCLHAAATTGSRQKAKAGKEFWHDIAAGICCGWIFRRSSAIGQRVERRGLAGLVDSRGSCCVAAFVRAIQVFRDKICNHVWRDFLAYALSDSSQ